MSGLFTVLIAEKDHIEAIQQSNKLFFEPFLESKELAFCHWNPAGQTLQESVPGLQDAVGRRKQWRAVIINNCNIKTSKMRNPYDCVDCSALSSLKAPAQRSGLEGSLEQWETDWKEYYDAVAKAKEVIYKKALEQPLQKLSTWLCFRPEDYIHNDIQETTDIYDWAMKELGREDQKITTMLETLEREQYKRALRMKEKIRREFLAEKYLPIAYPKEVYCISPRSAENNYFDPNAYWKTRQDSEYSTFADRNMFFDRMRFLVFDMLSYSHRNFRSDYIRFLATVLIFASNPIPGSAMQARRLYQLEVETDDAPLCTLVTSYDRKLAATSDIIENEMDKIRSEIPGKMTDKDATAMFCAPTDVAVLLDNDCDPDKAVVDADYGLFFDSPEDEYHKWNRMSRVSESALAFIVRQQSRSVRKSVYQAHLSGEVSNEHICRLTPLQLDDIRDFTDNSEDEMIASIPPDLTDISRYTKRIEQESEMVKKVLRSRMTKKTALTLSAVCLGMYLICFLPFIIANAVSIKAAAAAIALSAGMMALLILIMFIALLYLRSVVLKAVQSYNDTARGIINEIRSGLKQVSKYLSAFSNVRKGHCVQNYAKNNLDFYTRSLRIRKKHQQDIQRKRAYLAEKYQDYIADYTFCDEAMSRPYEYDFDLTTDYTYPAPFLAGDCRQIEFICNGNYVTVPSSFVTEIMVRMEEIYEK